MEIKIEVFSINSYFKVFANTVLNTVIINGKTCKMDANVFAQRLLDVVALWDKNMVNKNVFDAEEYTIEIEKNFETLKIVGCGKYPPNYMTFKSLLKEALEC